MQLNVEGGVMIQRSRLKDPGKYEESCNRHMGFCFMCHSSVHSITSPTTTKAKPLPGCTHEYTVTEIEKFAPRNVHFLNSSTILKSKSNSETKLI